MPAHALARFAPLPAALDAATPVIVFDGVCVLCSGFMRFVWRHDRAQRFRFVVAQSPLGQALYRHFRLDPVEFESNLVLMDGQLHTELAAFAAVMRALPWPWRALASAAWIPMPLSRWLYRAIADSRYRVFGRAETCLMPTALLRARFVTGGF